MIYEGVEGTVDLKKLFKNLNREYFGGQCPSNTKTSWSGKLKSAVGNATVSYKGGKVRKNKFAAYMQEIPVADVTIDTSSFAIKISKSFDLSMEDTTAVMLHEMLHIYLYSKNKIGDHHSSPEFKREIKRLQDQSGLNVPYKESNFKPSPKLSAKEGYIMVIKYDGGKYGANTFSNNFINNKWLLISETLSRWPSRSARVNEIEIYKATDEIVSKLTPKRSLKKLTWEEIEEEKAMNIRKKGKLLFKSDKQGGIMYPKYLGVKVKELRNQNTPLIFDNKGEWENIQDTLLLRAG